jgi:type II secretion system protein C
MTNKKIIVTALVVVAIVALQVFVLCSRPKIEIRTQAADIVEVQAGNNSRIAEEMTVPDVAFEKTVPVLSLALKLELVGTAVGNSKDPIAFIKDLDTNKQGIYKVGNMINTAKVIRIAKGVVDLDVNGISMSIEVKNRRAQNTLPATGAIVSVSGDEIVMSRMELLKAAGSIITTAKKMKIKPYSQSDKVMGMKLEGVDKGSLIEQAGIHDKDVLTAINNQKIDSYQKALQVFRKVHKQNEIKISLLREGELKQLCYTIKN